MKKIKNLLLTLVIGLSVTNSQAQNDLSSDHVFVDRLLKNMIKINDSTYMSKFPVSMGEYKAFMNECKLRDNATISVDWEYSNYANTQVSSHNTPIEMIQFFSNFISKETFLNTEYYDNYPMVGIDRHRVRQFLSTVESWYKVSKKRTTTKELRFRLPTIQEWEYASAVYDPLEDPNTKEKRCNYYQIPQAWIHYNPMTGITEILRPFDGAYSELKKHNVLGLTARDLFPPNAKGFYDLYGNASEMMYNENQLRGGNLFSTGYEIVNSAALQSDTHPFLIGFRIVIQVID